jgi:chromosome segregation ATPase
VTATVGQASLDVLAVAARQDTLHATLQSHEQASGARTAQLAGNQQQIQGSLDTVTATVGQASLDVLALNNGQTQLAQAVQTGRREQIDKLAALAQEQQAWLARLDATQAKAAMMADSLTALEQRIAGLQGALQTSVRDTTTALDANGQQRRLFETQVNEDLLVMMDSLAQLRQAQSLLQEQMTQVQKSTQGQAESIRSALEQMKQPPAELKISKAAEPPQPPMTAASAE